jgi:uncharacterized protein YceH (UPF0502 family)
VHIQVLDGPDCAGKLQKNSSRLCRFQDIQMPVQNVPENLQIIRSGVCRFQYIQMPDGPDCAGNLKKNRSRVFRFQDIQMLVQSVRKIAIKFVAGYAGFKIF